MDPDDLDDFLDGNRAELEARFRELEMEQEIDRMRRGEGGAPPGTGRDREPDDRRPRGADDPLADMKQALDSDEPVERYLLVICPHCQARNRMSLSRVRSLTPICGRCRQELAAPRP